MSFEPMLDRVLVKLSESSSEEKTAGGLYIPSSIKPRANSGTVIAVGAGRRDNNGNPVKMALSVGDKVLLPEYAGLEVDLPEGKFLLFLQDEILGVFKTKESYDDVRL
jgi:chaperonin GroES